MVTPQQRVEALEEIQDLTALRADESELDLSGRRAALTEQIVDKGKIAYAKEPEAAPVDWRVGAPKRAELKALKAEQLDYPAGSPQAVAIGNAIIKVEDELRDLMGSPPTPGQYSWADFRSTASLQRWTPAHKHELEQRLKGAGVGPMEGIGVAAQIENMRQLKSPAAERPVIDLRLRWGPDYEKNLAAYERGLARIAPSAATREFFEADGLGHEGSEILIDALVELGGRPR